MRDFRRPTSILAISIAVLTLFTVPAAAATSTLVGAGSTWKYLDNGTNQGTAWRAAGFNDSAWATGPAQLGYGDGDEQTVVGYGPNSSAKYITTYFRHAFEVANPAAWSSLELNVLRDDGAVVYLNGTEVWRTNMPTGTVSYTTAASSAVSGADETTTFYQAILGTSALVAGTNVLAVEIHQSGGTSSDISFDLSLLANDSASVTRGPYLQIGTPSGVIVRWRTNTPTDSRVQYGSSPASLTSQASEATLTTEHEVALTGLSAATTYYYSVGSSSGALAGGDAGHFFVTSPPAGSTTARFWILGDSGTADSNAAAVRNAYTAYTGSTHTNLVLMLGDNAYNTGTDSEYEAAVFDMYPAMLAKSVLWSTIGNHDTAGSTAPPTSLPYYQIFSLPMSGQAGGLASGTEDYYSFDYGDIHFVCLDSMTSDRSVGGAMMTWLQADLASTAARWIIAFWHHPPYTKGSHDSDTESQLIEMRQNALPILEAAGVDLVLSGHSHSYERSYLIDGHYGSSGSFTSGMKLDGGDGRTTGTGAYEKPTNGPAPHEGAVFAVAGSSGKISGGLLNHPAMFISLNQLGSMVLDVNGNRLDAAFLKADGTVGDSFTILKGTAPQPPAAPSNLGASATSTSSIQLTWTDNASDETSFRIERCTGASCTNFAEIASVGANTTSYTNSGLAAGTAYRYRVRASNGNGDSGYSNEAGATTQSAPAVPAAPSSLAATAVSKSAINLAWSDNSSNETGFRIERCTGNKCTNFAQVGTVGAGVTGFADSGLAANTTYRYRVQSYNATGSSGYSNIATGKTLRR